MNLEDVLEVVAVDAMPGDAGPLSFVAFVRGIPAGQGRFAFVIQPSGSREHVTARLPLEVQVPEAFAGRQVAVQVRVPSIPVAHGGWYDLVFEWEGQPLAANRFAIGQRGGDGVDPDA